jgi:hypothetical protein
MDVAFSVGRKIDLADAPPIFWRQIQEDITDRIAELETIDEARAVLAKGGNAK